MQLVRVALLALLVVAAAGCGTKKADKTSSAKLGRDPGTLVIAVDAFNADFDPASAYLLSEALIWRGVYESLIRLKGDSASEVEPLLADTWDTNPDKSSWTFHLHPGIKFSDGTPLDAQAVKANYVRTIRLELGTQFILGSLIANPEKRIVVVDPKTIRFDLGRSVPHFDVVLAAQYGMGIASPKIFTAHSKGPKDQGHEYLQAHAVGTGPYVMTTLEPGNQVVLEQNTSYWRGWSGHHFKKVIIKSIPETSTRRQLLKAGDVDIAYAGTAEDTAAIRRNPDFFVGDFKNLDATYIILGAYGPLAKPEARQAMNYLFPAEDFINSVQKKTLERLHGVYPDRLRTADRHAFLYDHNPKKASDLFAKAGVPKGTTFTYEFYTGFGKEAGLVLQEELAKIGMHLKLIEKSFSAMNADLTTDRPVARRANMYYWGWWPDYNDPSNFSWVTFHRDAAPDKCPCYNSGYYDNARVNQTIDAGFKETSDAKLGAMFKEAQDIMSRQDPPIIPVGQQLDETYFRKDIKGQVFNPLYILTWDYYALSRG
ncbi:MAG: ABC transporter substrate-binding protein [Actinomycetota bacterium]|nr:ABC transporter substrate-binding protein [Actinomycetota bacterium]